MHGKGILMQKMTCQNTMWQATSALLLMAVLCVEINAADPPGNVDDPRFQMLAIAGRAMLLDRETGKSWLLAAKGENCLLYTSPSPRDATLSRMPSSA